MTPVLLLRFALLLEATFGPICDYTLDLTASKFARSDVCFVKMVLLFSRRSLLFLFDSCMDVSEKENRSSYHAESRGIKVMRHLFWSIFERPLEWKFKF